MDSIISLEIDDFEQINYHINSKLPFVINTGVKVDLAFNVFFQEYKNEIVTILKSTSDIGTRKNCLIKKVTLFDYFNSDDIKDGWYLSKNFIKESKFKKFETTILNCKKSLFDLINTRKYSAVNLWLSPQNKFTGLHYDCYDNYNFQLTGSKKFFISPPNVNGFYRGKIIDQQDHVSNVMNIFNYDKNLFPQFTKHLTTFRYVKLDVGDILYLPAFWWHQVQTSSNELSVNINWWYLNKKSLLQNPKKSWGFFCLLAYRKLFQTHLS